MKTYSQFWFALTCLFLYATPAFSQEKRSPEATFDRAFYDIYMHLASQDVRRALQAADSLYRISATDAQRIRSMMLIGDMHHRMANRDSSIFFAKQAGKLAEQTNNYEWQARIYGVLSTQLREMGLVSQGRVYLKKGMAITDRIENEQTALQYKGLCYQEMGFYALEAAEVKEALRDFKAAADCFELLPESPSSAFALAQNHERLGLCYLEFGQDDSARFHYEHALALEPSPPSAESPVKGFIYNGLGALNLKSGNLEDAHGFLLKAQKVAETTHFPPLEIDTYKTLAEYYRAIGDTASYMTYRERFAEVQKNYNKRHRRYVDHAFLDVQDQLTGLVESRKAYTIFFLCSLAVFGIVAVLYVRKQRRQYSRFRELIDELSPKDSVRSAFAHSHGVVETQDNQEKELMPEGTRIQLLQKLDEFEADEGFRDKNMTIAVLAGKLKTNTKYLSHVINHDKRTDFNSYINALRINYVIAKMREDDRYLNYKISYLAEESGFSSHSQFATVFRNVTGLTPSKFINLLKKHSQLV